MNGLIIGFDLCDTYTQVAVWNEKGEAETLCLSAENEMQTEIPTTLCKCRRKEEWKIGAAACEMALLGAGIVVDKLLRLVKKGGIATLEGRTYAAEELLFIYLQNAFAQITDQGSKQVEKVVFTLKDMDPVLMGKIMKSMIKLGYNKKQILIVSHTEAYLYFLLRQSPENFANYSALFDLSKEGLTYIECDVQRGMKPQIVRASAQNLEEGFSLDILETDQGKKLADNILQVCADRQLTKKIVSSVFLSGRGMEGIQDWGQKSLAKICNRRKVYLETQLFAKGAVYVGNDELEKEAGKETKYPYCILCDGRIGNTISMDMMIQGLKKSLFLIEAGDRWFGSEVVLEFIVDKEDALELDLIEPYTKKVIRRKISLSELPNRPNKATRIRFSMKFRSNHEFEVVIKDLGFGAIFPASDVKITQKIAF